MAMVIVMAVVMVVVHLNGVIRILMLSYTRQQAANLLHVGGAGVE